MVGVDDGTRYYTMEISDAGTRAINETSVTIRSEGGPSGHSPEGRAKIIDAHKATVREPMR